MISRFAVKRPVATIILVSVILILAFFTYTKLAVDLYPEMKFPYAAVITSYPGTGPEEVESQVTKPLESTLNSLSNVKQIQSVSSSGSSMILISFNWGTDMSAAISDIREKTGMMETFLPSGADTPMVVKMDLDMMPVVQMGISAGDEMSLAQLQSIAEDVIEPRLSRIGDIAQVSITGGLEREIKVDVDPVKLENYGLTLSGVNQVLQAENFNMSSGKVKEGQREYYVRSLQEFESIDDIKNVAILTSSGSRICLNDIATITDGYKDDNQITRVNGKPAVGIHCVKQSDANTVEACEEVKDVMAEIEKELGMDLDIQIVLDQSKYIRDTLDSTKRMMVEGGILAILVLFIFLRNARSTLIVFTSIPLSIITTFILMYFNNSTINVITLGGLALGVGRMVDDSIVVFENIYRHRSLGLPPMEAALTGASEVGSAVIASTVTIMSVFFPILFAEGIAGVLFKPLAITVSFAIFCSLMVALTVVPLMSSRMLTDKSMQRQLTKGKLAEWITALGNWLDGLGEKYKVVLVWALSHRRRVVLTVTIMMIGSLALIPFIGAEFMPKMDSGEISVSIETDKGSLLKDTDATIADVEAQINSIPEVVTVFSSIGSTSNMMFNTGTQNDRGSIYVKLLPKDERDKDVDTIAEEIRKKVSNIAGAKIEVSVTDASSMGGSGGPINVQVRGDDLEVLEQISAQVTEIVRKVPGTREVTSSLDQGNPEVQVKIDRQRAAAYGLSPRQIAAEIQNSMLGTVASTYKNEGDEYDIRVRYEPQNHKELDYLQNLPILTTAGAVVRLSQVADFTMEPGPVQINRLDRVRTATISGYLLNRDLNSVMTDIQNQVGKLKLPAGYEVEYGGQNKDMVESFSSLAVALLLAIILVYAVMAIQYESFFNPFVIMFSVPTALIGVILGLLLTGNSLSVPAFIGIIMLVGIVVANAIVLVDYLKRLRDAGMERNAAIVEAGRVRLRPILMTALATILAMLPLALGRGEGSESEAPLAIVIIGGLVVSTLITLVLVPVVYSIFDDWGRKLRQRKNSKENIEETELTI